MAPFRVIRRDLEIAESAPLIGKVYDGEPFGCPKCKAPTRVIELVENLAVIGRILEQLEVGVPLACPGSTQRSTFALHTLVNGA